MFLGRTERRRRGARHADGASDSTRQERATVPANQTLEVVAGLGWPGGVDSPDLGLLGWPGSAGTTATETRASTAARPSQETPPEMEVSRETVTSAVGALVSR